MNGFVKLLSAQLLILLFADDVVLIAKDVEHMR